MSAYDVTDPKSDGYADLMAAVWGNRHWAKKRAWVEIRQAFEGVPCVVCGKPYESLHHVLARSLGGDDVVDNLAALCGDGFAGCHGLIESYDPRALDVFRLTLPELTVSYLRGRLGWTQAQAFLDRRYPLLDEVAA